MKKQIAIVCTDMIVGGVEKALLCMLDTIDRDLYDITLFTRNRNGPYIDKIPSHVRIWTTESEFKSSKELLIDDLKHLRFLSIARGLWLRLSLRMSKHPYRQLLLTQKIQRKIPKRFDCAIAYKLNYDDTAFLLGRIKARKKCTWVHGIVCYWKGLPEFYRDIEPIQKIFCVSTSAQEQLLEVYPRFTSKTDVIHNLVDTQGIIQSAQAPISEELSHICLMTVGRLTEEKGQDMIPYATRLLLDEGYDVHWYMVGDGPLRQKIEDIASELGVSAHVHLLGTKMEPYPYMKNCDIYVQTSRTEGWCLTVQEAKILQRPIVTTGLPVMLEQIQHGVNGSIAADITPEALACEIKKLIDHPDLRDRYSEELANYICLPKEELQKLYDFIEN